MPVAKKDPEITALEAIHSALKPLDPETRRKVLASVSALLEMPPVSPSSVPQRQSLRSASVRPVSLVELLQDKLAGTGAQRIALFAYYREKHEGLSRFERSDLKEYFATAKEPQPANYDRDFREAARKGWIHEDKEDSYLTSRGVEAVEAGFPGERKVRRQRTSRSTRKRKRPKARKT